MTAIEQLPLIYTDPLRAIALEILAERQREDVAVPQFVEEIIRRYTRLISQPLDTHLVHYAGNGGLNGLAHKLLKRNVKIAGLRVPERILIGKKYRPTIICTVEVLRWNAAYKRRAIAYDQRAVKPLEMLADLVEAAGRETVGEAFPEAPLPADAA